MCGIAGFMNMHRSDCNVDNMKSLLKKMTDCISHRGPDGEGQAVLDDGHVFLGHRRLAIIDLTANAHQPMTSRDERYTISYNGELYNYKELRSELIKRGYIFRSDSDTEVVLNAFAEWNVKSLEKFNGIFAFAIWDNAEKKLYLARDRYGTKPLYYSKVGSQLVFSSEYKSILLHPEFKVKVDLNTLKEYFTFQNIFSDNSFIEGIKLLEAGSYLVIDYNMTDIPKAKKFWDYSFEPVYENISESEYEEQLIFLFEQAVNRQLMSDVPLGSYLSGGIDSGAVTAIAAKSIPYLNTFTCGFDLHSASGIELSFDEREAAEYMSYCFKTEHYEMVLKSGDMERCMRDLVWHVEDPRVGQSYPNYYAAKLSSQFVKVVLAGTGGDELFAGYPWRYYRTVGCKDFKTYCSSYYQYWQRLLNNEELQNVLAPIYSEIRDYSTEEVFANVFGNTNIREMTPEQCINYSLYLEAKTFLHGLLVIEDKISMAHGLETRVPFLDNDLVDFAMKLPLKYKLSNFDKVIRMNENDVGPKIEKYFKKSNDGKLILRNAMGKKYIPDNISKAVKQGFSAPDSSWFKGESLDYVNSIIRSNNALIYNYMDKKSVCDIVDRHMNGLENRRLFIWSLLNFEEWLSLFNS